MEEALLPYLVPVLVLPLITLYLISSLGKTSRNPPPGSPGWPIVGENVNFAFVLGPAKYVKDRMRRYSPEVFRTSLLGEDMAVFCGAQGNKFVFSNADKLLVSWWPRSINKVLMFPGLVIDDSLVTWLKGFRYEVLKPESLKHYVAAMDAMARDQMESEWVGNSVVKVYPLARKYTFELACRLFMGLVDPDRIKRLSDPFAVVTNGLISVPIDFPGTAYNRAVKAGRLVREELMKLIAEKRKEEDETEEVGPRDILSKMLLVRDGDGNLLSEMVISNSIIGLLTASFESTSSAVASVLNYLAQLPDVYSEVLREQTEIAKSKGPDELLTWEDIEKMKYSWNVVRETFRLTPPAVGGFRVATEEFTYAGFTIPKGWKAFWTVHTSNKNPNYFPEPDKFDPSRFEGSGPAPFTFVPFGGGPRMCPGKEYARLEVLVFLHNVVTRFKLEKVIQNEKIMLHTAAKPAQGLPLRLRQHEK